MTSAVAIRVLCTVNAPYGTHLSAQELARLISDTDSAMNGDASAFAFFTEVSEPLQIAFIEEMGLDRMKVRDVAAWFADLVGYPLPLARDEQVRGM
ncbi:hypothetical protein G6L37_07040 [Agrobacterium rubi]|nr:hypothetical protein [Agrobacterium rubi]NTF25121.1 hypothetical protein [Agrobacterium rubi]